MIGGLFGAVVLLICAPLLAKLASELGAEYLAVSILGWWWFVSRGYLWKGLAMAGVGLWLTTWGLDPLTGDERYTFGTYQFFNGIKLMPFLIGIFAVSEVFVGAERALKKIDFDNSSLQIQIPGLKRLSELKNTIMRSSIIGTIIGIIPGEALQLLPTIRTLKKSAAAVIQIALGRARRWVFWHQKRPTTLRSGALLPTMTRACPDHLPRLFCSVRS